MNFDSPSRIPDSFYVSFKKDAEARSAKARLSSKALVVLSNVLPSSPENVKALSHALAESVGGRVEFVIAGERGSRRGFWVNMTEQQAKKLAADPRIDYIEANMKVEVMGAQSLPTDNSR